ncbi:calcium-binding protein [Streptomyces sp. JNUCC 64]
MSGALALSALTVPSAQAADGVPGLPDSPSAFSSAAAAAPAELTGKITKVTVNGGKDVVIGTAQKKFTVEVSASNPTGVDFAGAMLWHGPALETANDFISVHDFAGEEPCKYTATTATCKFVFLASPKAAPVEEELTNLGNKHAGTWNVAAFAGKVVDDPANPDGPTIEPVALNEKYKTVKVKRAAKLTANASPEPVRRGATITVKGDLTRADWGTLKYGGFVSGAVKLQFKKTGGSWATVKTVAADSQGKVKTTVKASVDGEYRFTYGGSSTTGGVTSAADRIDVR